LILYYSRFWVYLNVELKVFPHRRVGKEVEIVGEGIGMLTRRSREKQNTGEKECVCVRERERRRKKSTK